MKAIGIILAGGNNDGRLGVLTDHRAAAALPIGSCYRAIDFTLSNMSNSGIGKVAVLTQYNSRSLRDHLMSSKWWDFGRKQGGLFVFTPYTSNAGSTWFRGTADSIYQNMTFLKRSNEEYVVITSGDSVYKMDYRKVLEYHKEKNADITVVYQKMTGKDLSKFGILQMDADNKLEGFEEKPEQPKSDAASLGIYVISRTLLINLLNQIIPEGRYSLVKDIIIRFIHTLKIYGYEYDGYWNAIGTGIAAYFETNIRGAENVCAFAEKFGIKKIVFTSSIAPYGAAEDLKTEEMLPTPNTPYGISKLVAEKTHAIWQAKKTNERQLTIVRPGVVFGKGENGNFTRLYWGIRGGKFFYPGRKDTIKACIYVKELVRFMLYRLENHSEGVELYNCTFEPAFTIEQIVETMKKATGLQRTIVKVPGSLLMTVASIVGPLGGKALGICPARVKKLMISTNICGKKLADSGYKFHYTFEEAIKDWYRDNDGQCLR